MGSSPSKKASKVSHQLLEAELRVIFEKGSPEQAVALQLPTIIKKLNASFEGSDFTAETERIEVIVWELKNEFFINNYEIVESATRTPEGIYIETAVLIGTDELYRVKSAKRGSPQAKLIQTEHSVLSAIQKEEHIFNHFFDSPTDSHIRLVTNLCNGPLLLCAVANSGWGYTEEIIVGVVCSLLHIIQSLHSNDISHNNFIPEALRLPDDCNDPTSVLHTVKVESFYEAQTQNDDLYKPQQDIIDLGNIVHLLCTGVAYNPSTPDISECELQPFVEWDSVSPHAKQFVSDCLFGKCQSVSDCNSHDWMNTTARDLSPLPLSDVTERLQRYLDGDHVELTLPKVKEIVTVTSPQNSSDCQSNDDDRKSASQSTASTRRRSKWSSLSETRSAAVASPSSKERSVSDTTKVLSPPSQTFPSAGIDVLVRQLKLNPEIAAILKQPLPTVSPTASQTPAPVYVATVEDIKKLEKIENEELEERIEILTMGFKNYILLQQVAEVLSRVGYVDLEDTDRSLLVVQGNHFLNGGNHIANIWLFREAAINSTIATAECNIEIDSNLDEIPIRQTEQLLMSSADKSSILCRRVICELELDCWRALMTSFRVLKKQLQKPLYAARRLENREQYDRIVIKEQLSLDHNYHYRMAKDLKLLDELHFVEIDTLITDEESLRIQTQRDAFTMLSLYRIQCEYYLSIDSTVRDEDSVRKQVLTQLRKVSTRAVDIEGCDNTPRNELDALRLEFNDSD